MYTVPSSDVLQFFVHQHLKLQRQLSVMDPPNPGAETLPISIGAFISAILAFMMGGSWDFAGDFRWGFSLGIWLGLV